MNRRTFIKGAVIAASIPVPAVATPETQEQKCARLLLELMAECSQLPLPIRTKFGRGVDIPLGSKGNSARYNASDTGDQALWVWLSDNVVAA